MSKVKDVIKRLNSRRFPMIGTTAYAGNIASAAYMPQQTMTITVDPSKPDEDIDDAVRLIEKLEAERSAEYAARMVAEEKVARLEAELAVLSGRNEL